MTDLSENMDTLRMRHAYENVLENLMVYINTERDPDCLRALAVAKTELQTSFMWCKKALVHQHIEGDHYGL